MPAATSRRPFSSMAAFYSSPILNFDDSPVADADQLLFDFEDFSPTSPQWRPYLDFDDDVKPAPLPAFPLASPADSGYFDTTGYPIGLHKSSPPPDHQLNLSNWINDTDLALPSPSSPIPIPASYQDHLHFPSFSPAEFAAPRSISPSSFDDHFSPHRTRLDSISPQDTSFQAPAWYPSRNLRSSSRPSVRHSPMVDSTTVRQRVPSLRGSVASGLLFTSMSAPASAEPRSPRAYSRRAESVSANDDPDTTVRRKKRSPPIEDPALPGKLTTEPALKSVIRPPKLAPSAWQLYFTDWIQKQQAYGTRKLNVAQAAKEAGQEYACLTNEEKEPYKRRSQAAKEARERELAAYMRTLTPDDIKRENAFRAAQRKAGKSRKSNIKDPNAPKKPLSAYFMFLQRIRANPQYVRDIFGDETETTKQSVLAAARWRSMTDAERQPFLAQAEQEKMEYEAARRVYEEGSPSYGSSNINFSILPGSPPFPSMKMESESEGEGFAIDDTLRS
ncbi:hypothetical protein H0H87_001707 [Tephrocybe sp. NHM501043]|nr:hypothetical protein H0H87_001707 [Tephrocybe sp. NHM501043]